LPKVNAMRDLIERAYLNAAGFRNYELYVAAPRNGEAPPLFVMLHGCGQNAADFAAGTRMNELADECGGVVLYPEQCKMANMNCCWNWHKTKHQCADRGEPFLLSGMTRQVMAERGIDPARVYVAGMSAGGAMAVILGQAYPDLYAAVGVHSGLPSGVAVDLMSALSAMSNGPVAANPGSTPIRARGTHAIATIVFHGDGDTVVHPSNGEAVHAQAKHPHRRKPAGTSTAMSQPNEIRVQEGCQGRTFTRTSQMRNGVPQAELWMVHGAGHAWAGGSAEGTYTDADGPDASREMMRFFLQQRLGRKMGAREKAA
jgi:poly(hydroxyalkanoate) depolymerase family esterase